MQILRVVAVSQFRRQTICSAMGSEARTTELIPVSIAIVLLFLIRVNQRDQVLSAVRFGFCGKHLHSTKRRRKARRPC